MANPFSIEVGQINPLQELMQGYQFTSGLRRANEQDGAFNDATAAIRNGDNAGLMEALLKARQIGPALEVAKLGRQEAASRDFAASLGNIFAPQGPQAQPSPLGSVQPPPQPSPLAQLMTPPGVPPRAPVQSSPTVWGDDEAIKSGLYDSPGQTPKTTLVGDNPVYAQPPQGQPAPARIGASPSLGGVSLDRAIPTLLQAASNSSLPKEQQETARMLLGKAFDQFPQEIRKLEIFKQRPDLLELALQEKRAGATTINTAEGMDAAQTKARIAIDTHAVQDLSKKVASGRSAIPLLTQMMAINDKTPGGWAGAAAPYFAKAAATLGIDVPEGASNAELFNAMSRQFIPSVRDPGSTSNYEQSLYLQAVPSLSQSPEGRSKIAGMMKAQIQRNSEILATYRKFVGRPELDDKLSALDAKPIFSADDRKVLEAVAPSGGKSSTAPSQDDIEAEIRRRNLR